MKRKRHRWIKLLVLLVVLCAGGIGFIQTRPGKVWLASTLSNLLSRSENTDVHIGTITGWIPIDLNIEEVTVADGDGEWLMVRNLDFRWIVKELVDGRIRLRRLGADEVVLRRWPKGGGKGEGQKKPTTFKPIEIQFDGVNVSRLRLEKGVAGQPLEYAVHSGGITLLTTGRLTGMATVGGDAEGVVHIDAGLTGSADDHLAIMAELERMVKPTFGLDHLSGEGEATIRPSGIEAEVKANLAKGGQEGSIETQLHYAKRKLTLSDFQFEGAGYALGGDMELEFGKQAIEVALNTSFSDSRTNQYTASGTATVKTAGKTWGVDLHALDLYAFDAVGIHASGTVAPSNIALKAVLDELAVGDIPFPGASNFTGRVNGTVTVDGTLAEPEIIAGLVVNRFGSSSDALDELPSLDFGIVGGVSDGMLFGSTVITNYISGNLDAQLAMPCTLSLLPYHFSTDSKRVEAHLDADLDLGIFNRLAMFQDQVVSGMLDTEVDYAGNAASGFLRIGGGRYEHYGLGIVFQDLDADLEATPAGFKIRNASATDGNSGRLDLTGGLGKSGLDLKLGFNRAHIVRRDEIDAVISGELDVTGRPSRPDVKGRLTVDRAEILLDNIPAPPPPVLNDFDAASTNQTGVAGSRQRKPPPVGLDINVDIPEQTFVVAAMIEATLQGKLHVGDAPKGVAVRGAIEPRRGFVNFVGKKFRFVEGSIRMDGSVPVAAVFDDLAAEYGRSDVTARLVLNGPVNDPRFRLESTPQLPEDEILSHVLFNRDTSSISPYQAYQIAAAARQLSGGLSGPGFMYGVRQAIGVDTFELREADAADEASTVAAGKYLATGVYVEVNRSLDARGQTGMMAEFELNRHFSIETYTGPKLRPGIGLNWRVDY